MAALASLSPSHIRHARHRPLCNGSERLIRGTQQCSAAEPSVDRSRREVGAMIGVIASACSTALSFPAAAEEAAMETILTFVDMIAQLENKARAAYAERDFQTAVAALSELMYQQPNNPKWSEMRAAALVDGKNFAAAIMDYNEALNRTPDTDKLTIARLLAGRALALEGEGAWEQALTDYEEAQSVAVAAGEAYDPYILNSMANCSASLGQWEDARLSYKLAADTFQSRRASKSNPAVASTLERQDGAVYATTNAALMTAQIGELAAAKKELEYVSRRAAGNVDAKAALAALYYEEGRTEEAEEMWDAACNRISVGCSKYKDVEWLSKVRRWPPSMVSKLQKFLNLRGSSAAA